VGNGLVRDQRCHCGYSARRIVSVSDGSLAQLFRQPNILTLNIGLPTILETDTALPPFALQDGVVVALVGSHPYCRIEWADEEFPVTDLGSLIHVNDCLNNRLHIRILNHDRQKKQLAAVGAE